MVKTDYLRKALTPHLVERIVCKIVKDLEPRRKTFDAIALRGMSGALIAPIVANRLKCGLIAVRKDRESHHSVYDVEGSVYSNYIIIDDFIESGNTIRTILDDIKNIAPDATKCVGVYLYADSDKLRNIRQDIARADIGWVGTVKRGISKR